MNMAVRFLQTKNLVHRTNHPHLAVFEITQRTFVEMDCRIRKLSALDYFVVRSILAKNPLLKIRTRLNKTCVFRDR